MQCPLYLVWICVQLPWVCFKSRVPSETGTQLNLTSITWHHSGDTQTCLTVRSCLPSASRSGNKNWRQIILSPKRFLSNPVEPEPKSGNAKNVVRWGNKIRQWPGQRGISWRQEDSPVGQSLQLSLTSWQLSAVCLFSFSISFSLNKFLKDMQYYLPQSIKWAHWEVSLWNYQKVDSFKWQCFGGPKREHEDKLQQALKSYSISLLKEMQINYDIHKEIRQEFKCWWLSCFSQYCLLLFS